MQFVATPADGDIHHMSWRNYLASTSVKQETIRRRTAAWFQPAGERQSEVGQPKKRSPPDSWTPGDVFLNRQSVHNCALILKLNKRSCAPEFSYRNAPPAPYKGMQLKRRVHNPQTPQATRKQLQTDQNHVKASTGKPRPNFTGAEVEVLLQNVDVSILFHYGYIHAIEFSAYLFIQLHLQCSCSAFIYFRTSRCLVESWL